MWVFLALACSTSPSSPSSPRQYCGNISFDKTAAKDAWRRLSGGKKERMESLAEREEMTAQ